MTEPISRIVIDAHLPVSMGEGVLVQWAIDAHFPPNLHPLQHTVIVGTSPTAQFTVLAAVGESLEYLDNVNRALTRDQDVWYAIVTTDRKGKQYFSKPQKMACMWEKREWLAAREVVRQVKVRLIRRKAGVRGYHLRRRTTGVPCAVCIDPDTGQITDPNCLTCYGTGITGGYYPPIECWVDMAPERIIRRLTADQGMISQKISAWNVLAYPPFYPNDFWLDAQSGLRYKIGSQVAVIAHLQGVPILRQLEAEAAELSDVIYKLPVTCT